MNKLGFFVLKILDDIWRKWQGKWRLYLWGWYSSKRASGMDIAQRPGDHGPQFLQILLLSSLKGVNLVRSLEISSGEINLFPPMTNQNHLQNTPAGLQYPKP